VRVEASPVHRHRVDRPGRKGFREIPGGIRIDLPPRIKSPSPT
jgi:hypothetical protein